MSNTLLIHDLCVSRGDKSVFTGVSFSATSGQLISLLGSNGAGKSTLLQAICGLIPINEGLITFNDRHIKSFTTRQLAQIVSYLPQKLQITYPIAVKDFILMGRFPYSSPIFGYGKKDHQVVESTMQALNLEHLSSRLMHQLSGGEQQRALIASAIAQNAKFILMDEPTASLDPVQQEVLYQTIKDIKCKMDVCFLVATHQLFLTTEYSDRVLALHNEKLLFNGTTSEFCNLRIKESIYNINHIPQ